MDILGWWWKDFPVVSSTNDVCLELSSVPPAKRYVITAETQTHGRGRRGRTWCSQKGNLFATFALKNDNGLLNFLPFILSLSLSDSVRAILPNEEISLKWPNDVLLKGSKLAGILLEKGDNDYIIAGLGVNLVTSPEISEDILYPTTSLADCGATIDCKLFLRSYISFLNKYLDIFYTAKPEIIIQQWLAHAHGLGQQIIVKCEKHIYEGKFIGLADDGALILEYENVKHKIYAGDVFYK